ncbi:MAG: hypothetical protein ACE5K2_08265 [Candidatus Zixiibacteriota bacterium]
MGVEEVKYVRFHFNINIRCYGHPGIALEEQLDNALADVHKNWRRYLGEYKRRKEK